MKQDKTPVNWSQDTYRVLKQAGVKQVAYVPDAGHSELIRTFHADREAKTVVLTTEEEGVAMLGGAWLGGERGVLLMQSSGVGNCINILGTIAECRFPLLALVTMRGQWGEFNPWQVPMSQATAPSLAAIGVIVYPVDDPARVAETVEAAAQLVFNAERAAAVLISQRIIGAKSFKK
ncbi:MAG TPA: thiamine pyrophosphate-binding protein [Burkholderiales bacterium]|nr:thiamine pyrophosphate-binding protein [Burkholderiales bacterium]